MCLGHYFCLLHLRNSLLHGQPDLNPGAAFVGVGNFNAAAMFRDDFFAYGQAQATAPRLVADIRFERLLENHVRKTRSVVIDFELEPGLSTVFAGELGGG